MKTDWCLRLPFRHRGKGYTPRCHFLCSFTHELLLDAWPGFLPEYIIIVFCGCRTVGMIRIFKRVIPIVTFSFSRNKPCEDNADTPQFRTRIGTWFSVAKQNDCYSRFYNFFSPWRLSKSLQLQVIHAVVKRIQLPPLTLLTCQKLVGNDARCCS